MEFDAWLTANGFDAAALTAAQRLKLQATWRAESDGDRQDPADKPKPAADVGGDNKAVSFAARAAAAEAESARVEYIHATGLRYMEANKGDPAKVKLFRELTEAAAADPKTDTRAFDLACLRNDRAAAPLAFAPKQKEVTAETLEAAVCRAGGLKDAERHFDERTLDATDKLFGRGIGLQELVGRCAERNGFRGHVGRNLAAALKAAFAADPGHDLRADVGPSTLSIGGILSNVANKFLRDGFMGIESVWREITAVRSVRDFKQISSYSLTGDLQYEKVAPGGEIKHGTLGDETYTNQADTYGKMLGIDRRDLINDDLGALTRSSSKLGRGGALKINDVFWTAFLNNSTFFTSGRGNYDDGTDTAFNEDGLNAAMVFWSALTDPDGKPMAHMPAILLVPPRHKMPARRLMESAVQNSADQEGADNVWRGMFRVASSVYMANSSYTGYSALAWYLLCDPNDLPVIETCFLNGQEMPTVETADLDFNRLGIALRGYHDFGVSLQEYRGGMKFKGEA